MVYKSCGEEAILNSDKDSDLFQHQSAKETFVY